MGHQFFLAKTISLACEVPIESVDTMNHLSPLSFLISTCLLVVAMNAVLILLAPVKAGLEYLHHSGDKKKRKKKAKKTSVHDIELTWLMHLKKQSRILVIKK